MIKKVTQWHYHKALGMLLVRLAGGVVFLVHGWSKFGNLAGAEDFFMSLGLPGGTATVIAILEVVGGLMLILGVVPRLAALVLGIEMIAALILVGIPMGAYEMEMLLAAACFAIFLCGAGSYSLYSMERE